MKKLSEILGAKKGVDLEFIAIQEDETRDGLPIVRLVLKNTLPIVYGRNIVDPVTEDRVRLEATDVDMVSIGKDTLDEIERLEQEELLKPEAERNMPFTWIKEGESGRLKCDLKLDVAGNTQEVWVTKEGFAAFAAKKRNERRSNQRTNLVARIRKAKTEAEFKTANPDNKVNGPLVTANTEN